MKKIDSIWNDLENDRSLKFGLLLRRYASFVLPDVYVALKQPESLRCIALRLNSAENLNVSAYENLKDIRLEVLPDEKDNSKKVLIILLLSKQHKDVFAILCEDLISAISSINDERKVIKELLNRLEKWHSLFEKANAQGMTLEEQLGLFGELYFLRKWLLNTDDIRRCIQSWIGPEKAVRDFQLNNWAVEVKTTHSKNHEKVHISSERQLDITNISSLFLFHVSLDVQQLNGETLNQIVDSVSELLTLDIIALSHFNSKLLQGGYFSHHRLLYDNTGYIIRRENFYNVRDEFPRLEERDVRKGVGDVKYSIILSDYSDYIVNETLVIETIN